MSECHQGLTLTQNMSWDFLLVPHLLHKGLSISPIMYRCLLRVLCPVRRLVTTQDCVLLKDSSLVLAVGLGPEISLRACLWVLVTPCHIAICWLSVQRFIFLLVICPKEPEGRFWSNKLVNSEPIGNFISTYPRMSGYPGESHRMVGGNVVQCFWHWCSKSNVILAAWRAFKAAWLSEKTLTYISGRLFIWIS